ncbi:glycoside hydrolase family 43 protein [Chitinophaga rhizophila]|uniref:Glycoside hydrolase family 43 protein n=1 Tax=Chitinophaga rhizophila TaxID=2866212 RepID=A0ABS7GDG8_9BACT|nr:glycoside hydrolase family 43 protein [Chitinophaga rhizophila]MBW8685722.1 glycoside hydrolase family 43 protein [Chitinophaga rhizophila]
MLRSLICLLVFLTSAVQAQDTFRNPVLPGGPDPWCTYKDGHYYYMHTMGNRLELWKTKNIAFLKDAPHKTIWTPPASGAFSKEIWAPEIHFIKGKWYVYFAADNGDNQYHRIYALENSSPDPMLGVWEFKGKVADIEDKWAIDASVFEHRGKLYMTWSGWEGDKNGRQDIYIAAMKDPLTIQGKRVKISSPQYTWETKGDLRDPNLKHLDVNEGPQMLKYGKQLFIVYSGSACWTDDYALGILVAAEDSDLLDPSSWKKRAEPVFRQSPENKVYGPGHNSFFTSPDGKEHWILYHANDHPGDGCGNKRSPRIQRFRWDEAGWPVFGKPLQTDTLLQIPRS